MKVQNNVCHHTDLFSFLPPKQSFASALSMAKLGNPHQWFIQFAYYWKIKWSKAWERRFTCGKIIFYIYQSVWLHRIADMLLHITLADDKSFVFDVVNGTLHLRCTRLPALFPKSGMEDLKGPFRIFALELFMSYVNADWELMFPIQSKSPPQRTPSACRSLCVSNNYTARPGI